MKKLFTWGVLTASLIILMASPVQARINIAPSALSSHCACLAPPSYISTNDTLPKVSLLKAISNFLKFHKNIQNAERKRILNVISNSPLKDSIMVNAREIDLLNKALSKTINQRFDSLVSLINVIKLSQGEEDSLSQQNTTGNESNTTINDTAINELINKILPLLQKKAEKDSSVLKNLTMLKNIRYFYGKAKKPVDTVKIDGFYELKLERKEPIYSFFRAPMGGNYFDYNFSIISTLIYDGYLVNGETGNCTDPGREASSDVLRTARQAGCNILLSFNLINSYNIASFLQDGNQQEETFINTVLKLMQAQNADGINLNFNGINNSYRMAFVTFVHALLKTMRSKFPQCQLVITVPSGNKDFAYDINKLNAPGVKFLIDFGANTPGGTAGPPASLKGGNGNGIESTISRYLNSNVASSKFIIGLPYYGSQWEISNRNKTGRFIKYLTLDEIASRFHEPSLYDPQTASTFINLLNENEKLTGQIWYNNAKAMDNIYGFILQNGLGGIAVEPLETKIGYADIWAGIGNNFLQFDTLPIFLGLNTAISEAQYRVRMYVDSIKKKERFSTSWDSVVNYSWESDSLGRGSLYKSIRFLFEYPCKKNFILSDDTLRQMYREGAPYLSYIKASSALFFRVSRVTEFFLAVTSLFFLLGFIIIGYIYISKLRKLGETWKFRKAAGIVLLLLAALMILFVFMYMFLSDLIPGFGANSGAGNMACYNMPFGILLAIIISGILLGVLIMRYLIFPIIKKDDVP
ncbi:MAG: glycoside hydrolase family 18 protein [Chitinophagaceae bacterium]|nr:MAG: glycoside hydrolase family 18 protein [Chitinophagaceae bacterium]